MLKDYMQPFHEVISMGGFFLGTNWHGIEESNGSFFRWTGPESVSTIQITIPRHLFYRLNLTIYSAASDDILTGLQIKADGTLLETIIGRKRNPAYVTAVMPSALPLPEKRHTLLSLCLPNTLYANEIVSGSTDTRKLGIAVSQINFFPLSRPLFTAQKPSPYGLFDGVNYLKHHPEILEAIINNRYLSAFDFFCRNNYLDAEATFDISPEFDERPGDIYDIFQWLTDIKLANFAHHYSSEINQLRNIVLRQNDTISRLIKEYK